MTAIIVGAGIAGLSTALALARRGVASTVVEQAPMIETVGAGLQLSPNATRILFGWGLEIELRANAVAPERAEVRDAATKRLLVENRLGAAAQARWGAPYLTVTRSALQSILLRAVEASGWAEVRLGARAIGVDAAALTLADGAVLHGSVVIGCDGLHSAVQAALFQPSPPRFTGQTVWRGLAALDAPPRVQVWTGPRRHFVRYPVAPGLVNMVAVTEAARDDVETWDAEGEAHRLAAAFADWPDAVRATIAAVAKPWRSALYDRPPLSRWTTGAATLLGDAAHPMLPFLAQGAGMAIEDAEVLAGLLATTEPAAALEAYARARLTRTAKVQAWASRNARLFHLPSPAALGLFGAARVLDRARGADPEARFDWLYGWRP